MTRCHHLPALALVAMVMVGGEYLMVILGARESIPLRGGDSPSFAETVEKKTNVTIDAALASLKEESAQKNDLMYLVERLKTVEEKVLVGKPATQEDIERLQKQLLKLNQKVALREDKRLDKDDLTAIEAKISTFQDKLQSHENAAPEDDITTLKERVASFEEKLKLHEEEEVKQQDIESIRDLVTSFENKLGSLGAGTTTVVNEEPYSTKTANGKDKKVSGPVENDSTTRLQAAIENAKAGRFTTRTSKIQASPVVNEEPSATDIANGEERKFSGQKEDRSSTSVQALIEDPKVGRFTTRTSKTHSSLPADNAITSATTVVATPKKRNTHLRSGAVKKRIVADDPSNAVATSKTNPIASTKPVSGTMLETSAGEKGKVIDITTARISGSVKATANEANLAASSTATPQVKQSPTELLSKKRAVIVASAKGSGIVVSSPELMAQPQSTKTEKDTTKFITPIPVKVPVLTKQEQRLLESFDPKNAPIMGEMIPDKGRPVKVRILLMKPKKTLVRVGSSGPMGLVRDEMVNIVIDGFEKSPYFEVLEPTEVPESKGRRNVVLEENDDVVWAVDSTSLAPKFHNYSVDEEVLAAAKATIEYQQSLKQGQRPNLKVVFFDYHDMVAGTKEKCGPARQELINLLGVGNVRQVVGKVTAARKWNDDAQWIERGTIWANEDYKCHFKPTLRAAYTVRSDYAEAVVRSFPKLLVDKDTKQVHGGGKPLTPVDTLRPVDVRYYWDAEPNEERKHEFRGHSKLRTAVAGLVASLNGSTVGERVISALVGTVSDTGRKGRTQLSQEYLESLLKTKIVVVAQRDSWEDHYRLMEAITGGALVMTDLMLSLPSGLVDGESILMYRSSSELQDLLTYYLHPDQDEARLSIARKGYDVAMKKHRTYHRMEEVFFGKSLSSLNP